MVIMSTVAILKISNPKCTTTHANDYSCEVTLLSDQTKYFKLSWLSWKRWSFLKCQTINAHINTPRIIPVMFHYNQTKTVNFHGYHGNSGLVLQ